jgi:hypothetical protein
VVFQESDTDLSDAICLTFTRGLTKFFPKMLKYPIFVQNVVAPLYHLCFRYMEKNLFGKHFFMKIVGTLGKEN